MTVTDGDLLMELDRAFEILTSSVPTSPTRSWDDVLRSTSGPTRRAAVDSVAGPIDDGHEPIAPPIDRQRIRRFRPPGRRLLVASAAACVVAVSVIVPLATQHGAPAAAAMLDEAAQASAEHGVLSPGPGQALEDSYALSIRAAENNSAGVQSSVATFQGVVKEWTLSGGSGHEQVSYGSPHFPSPAAAQAWVYGRGIPLTGTISFTTHGPVVSMGPAIGAFNVSALPTDPPALARDLAGSATGVPGLDLVQGPDVIFHRVALLLSTPLLGSSPALESALYRVLASLPDIESLGPRNDHSERTGQAFSERGSATTLIVDTRTGALLEMLESTSTSTFPTSGGPSAGTETLQWLDPAGESVIPATSVPSASS